MWGGYMALFGALWLVRIRAELWRRKGLAAGRWRRALA